MKKTLKRFVSFVAAAAVCFSIGSSALGMEAAEEEIISADEIGILQEDDFSIPELNGTAFTGKTELKYAKCFNIYNYEGGYSVLDIPQSGIYLCVPEGKEVPEGAEDMVILQKPLNRLYLAATSAMALFSAIDAVGNIRLSGLNASGWYVDAAVKALESGSMLFAGKYSAPDYETLISEDCNAAIESTMIYHSPKVKEMIEDLDIPVLIDRSSYEGHPLGKTEWVKLYGVLVDKEEEAAEFFDRQASVIEEIRDFPNTEKTVVFFYVNMDGSIVIRSAKDFIPAMIEMGGGRYVFRDLEQTGTSTSFSITMEDFYTKAHEADYIIYNGSINSPIESIDELIGKDALFADFKAVQDGNVWTVGKEFYQRTDITGQFIKDINQMLTGNNEEQMTFLVKVN